MNFKILRQRVIRKDLSWTINLLQSGMISLPYIYLREAFFKNQVDHFFDYLKKIVIMFLIFQILKVKITCFAAFSLCYDHGPV